METIAEEYYNQREQEIINFYKKHYKDDPEINSFIEKYIGILKSCQGLASSNPLVRERTRDSFPLALDEFEKFRNQVGSELLDLAIQELFSIIEIMSNSVKWEGKAGAITAAMFIIEKFNYTEFEQKMFNSAIQLLFDKQFMLLQNILSLIRTYTKKYSSAGFQSIQEKLFENIKEYWNKYDNLIEEEVQISQDSGNNMNDILKSKIHFKTRSDINLTLESLYKALFAFLEEIPDDIPVIDDNILELIYKTRNHSKQEMRVLGYILQFFNNLKPERSEMMGNLISKIPNDIWAKHVVLIGEFIINLMSDEYTTVRHQATKSVYKFIDRAATDNLLAQFTPSIVPRILINRYHPAQALSKDSINLWKVYLDKNGVKGREVLAKLANEACEFYLNQLKQTHHEILRAACLVLRELVNKVEGSTDTIIAHFDEIITLCFNLTKNDNPVVRSSCFSVLQSIVAKCPQQSKPYLPEIINIGFFQVCFNFNSEEVAESVAAYLGAVYTTFYDDVHQIFMEKINEKLQWYTREEEEVKVSEEIEPIKYKGTIVRPKGFEVATAALIVLVEIVPFKKEALDPNLELIHNIINLKYTNHDSMLIYAWRVLNKAFTVWDKKVIKTEIDIIQDALTSQILNPRGQVSTEINLAVKTLSDKLGTNILKARLKDCSKQIDTILTQN